MDLGIRGSSPWLTGVAISLVILGGCSAPRVDDGRSASEHEVPDVRGLTTPDACDSLLQDGFKIEVAGDTKGDVCSAHGAVTDQSPSPGEALEGGSTVTVHVSPTKTIPEG